jgi:hypothetical protein
MLDSFEAVMLGTGPGGEVVFASVTTQGTIERVASEPGIRA